MGLNFAIVSTFGGSHFCDDIDGSGVQAVPNIPDDRRLVPPHLRDGHEQQGPHGHHRHRVVKSHPVIDTLLQRKRLFYQ